MKVTSNLLLLILIVIILAGCGAKVSPLPNTTSTSQQVTPTSPTASELSGSTNGSPSSVEKSLPSESMISASQLDAGIKAKNNWQIIDVREPSEFASGHVPTAVNIPLGGIANHVNAIAKDKDIILVCLNGSRSFTAWQTLAQKGYTPQKVKVLIGGMEQWKSLGIGEITESIGGC
ncbi:rhodanese-like domain-containing protein [Desulfosporosinus sp. FKB]|uniref:rhodanese-like domain-containing protein n=1 Tax=Desulfosporosinus sp. FKB TaxID=1969835 RepID=UPI000B499125|nr:rhodanese-like domain-containing protein [Desulfosporosinus sp. FKB]